MAEAKRVNRSNAPTAILYARIEAANLEQVKESAEAVGISAAAYIDLLIERDRKQLDHRFRPRWWRGPLPAEQTQLFSTNEESPSRSA